MNKQIVKSLKNSFKILKSTSSGIIKESDRLVYRSGLKMAALGCKEDWSIGKISKNLKVRPSLVSGVFKSFEASPDPTS